GARRAASPRSGQGRTRDSRRDACAWWSARAARGGSLRRVWRALLPVAVVPLAVACGGSHGEGAAILARAQDGLRRLGSSAVHLHVRVETPVPVQRNFDVGADQLPKLDLTRWAKDPQRVACGAELE